MPRSKEIQEQMRNKIVDMYQSGKGYKAISKACVILSASARVRYGMRDVKIVIGGCEDIHVPLIFCERADKYARSVGYKSTNFATRTGTIRR